MGKSAAKIRGFYTERMRMMEKRMERNTMKKILLLLIMLIIFSGTVSGEDPALSPSGSLLRLRLYRNDFMMPENYEIHLLGDAYYLYINDDLPLRVDPQVADDLVRMIDKYDIRSWDGFDESNPEVDDGEFFYFTAVLTDGTSIYAHGENAFPVTYDPAASLMEGLILRADGETIEEDITGTYVYEGEGFGGEFSITISEDGTYSFYEGPLSSYLGGGSWDKKGGSMILSEENGKDMIYHFAVGNGVLVFIERGSDNFPYVTVPDGGRFFRR